MAAVAVAAGCTESKSVTNAASTESAESSTARPSAETTAAPVATTPPTAPDGSTGATTVESAAPESTTPPTDPPPSTRPAPTGTPFVIGIVNTEGAPGLDFPEFTTAFKAAAARINAELGGIKGRPVQLEICVAKGNPESSQACAQELAGKKVDLAVIGLDIFVAYPTFSAAKIPVFGAVPVLDGDYTADAVYLTAGNLVVQGSTANAITNPKYLGAKNVVVISNDTAATLSALGSLEPALKKGGATVTTIKGGENETDAGYLALMQQAADLKPDAIVSLYSESGCVALMRARVELGVTAPVFSNTSCLSNEVIDAAGDAAVGWFFAGATGEAETVDLGVLRTYVSAETGEPADDVNVLGFTGVGWIEMLSVWQVADELPGTDVTGAAILQAFRDGKGHLWGTTGTVPCGSIKRYKSVCSFAIPFAEYTAEGSKPAFGGDPISAIELLPA